MAIVVPATQYCGLTKIIVPAPFDISPVPVIILFKMDDAAHFYHKFFVTRWTADHLDHPMSLMWKSSQRSGTS